MNYIKWIDELGINSKILDSKKQQTDYKIKYVTRYIQLWLFVNSNRSKITDLNFIDCMCNAGIYQDGDLCTAAEVLTLFIEAAQKHPDKQFNLFVNDHSEPRMKICKLVLNKILGGFTSPNLIIYYHVSDVNDYLLNFKLFDTHMGFASTVLFVDPYDFGTVKIDHLTAFISKYYCEVIFNFFISDYVRNGVDARIRECIGEVNITNKDELVSHIVKSIKVGKMKYVFSYKFKTSKNTELYQIIYVTPHPKGLEKLKDALWEIFNGQFFHRNHEIDSDQFTFLTEQDDRESLLNMHSCEARALVFKRFSGETVEYKQIDLFLLENTMMQTSNFIRYIIKPMISEGKIIKHGTQKNRNNYKNDQYTIKKELTI